MAKRKTTPEHDPIHDVYILQDEDDEEIDEHAIDDSTIIETQAVMDWIEYDPDEEEETPPAGKGRNCRLTFHVDLPEHIAQHLFANHVKDGSLTIEFQPVSGELRRKDSLVRS